MMTWMCVWFHPAAMVVGQPGNAGLRSVKLAPHEVVLVTKSSLTVATQICVVLLENTRLYTVS